MRKTTVTATVAAWQLDILEKGLDDKKRQGYPLGS